MAKDYKVNKVEELKERLSDARAIVLVDYKGINVEQDSLLRGRFREEKVDYFVAKNPLNHIGLKGVGINCPELTLNWPN